MSKIYALDHVQLAMPEGQEDLGRAFYIGVLGLSEFPKPAHLAQRGGLWLTSGTLKLHLGIDWEFRAAQKAHPGLLVQGIEELAAKCVAAGYPVVADDMLDDFKRVFVFDPFGNRIELLEPVAKEMEKQAVEWKRSQNPEEFRQLEERLLQPELRRSPQLLATLLADDFIEFGSSGRIFDKSQAIAVLQHEVTDKFTLTDFQTKVLAADVVLTTYQTARHSDETDQITTSLRSSIWKFLEGRWQVVFHQRTALSKR